MNTGMPQLSIIHRLLGLSLVGLIAAVAVKYAGTMPWFNDLNGGAPLPVNLSWEAYRLAALGGIFSFLALFYPAFRASRVGLLTYRSRSGRSTGSRGIESLVAAATVQRCAKVRREHPEPRCKDEQQGKSGVVCGVTRHRP